MSASEGPAILREAAGYGQQFEGEERPRLIETIRCRAVT